MAKRTYPPEFRQQLIALVRAGRTPESLAKEFEPSAQTIRNWAVQADRDGGLRTDGLTTDDMARSPSRLQFIIRAARPYTGASSTERQRFVGGPSSGQAAPRHRRIFLRLMGLKAIRTFGRAAERIHRW
jgi:transposase-like protein